MTKRTSSFSCASMTVRHVTFILLLAIISNTILAAVLPIIEDWRTEATRIAASVAQGQGFSSPFSQPTGPSAWISPVYPYLLACIFSIFGVFTTASYWVAIAVNIVVHALTCILLYYAAGEAFGPRVGWYSACALASFPLLFYPLVLLHVLGGGFAGLGLFISPNIIWYTHLSELAIVLLIWLTLRPTNWIIYGTAWGVTSLINPAVLSFAPAFLAWRLWRRESWRNIALAIVVTALCVTPWLARNYLVFHRLIFIRDNFGVELKLGNQIGQNGHWKGDIHPDRNAYELSRVVAMGEAEYTRAAGLEARQTIRSNPGEFVRNTIRRVGYWWIGSPMQSRRLGRLQFIKYLPSFAFAALAFYGAFLTLQRKDENALLFVAALFFYPLIYYITHTFDSISYQYPIQPEMLALAISVVIQKRPAAALEAEDAITAHSAH